MPGLNSAQVSTGFYDVQVVNNLGAVMRASATNTQSWQADVSNLTQDVYIIQVVDNKTKTLVGKGAFVKL